MIYDPSWARALLVAISRGRIPMPSSGRARVLIHVCRRPACRATREGCCSRVAQVLHGGICNSFLFFLCGDSSLESAAHLLELPDSCCFRVLLSFPTCVAQAVVACCTTRRVVLQIRPLRPRCLFWRFRLPTPSSVVWLRWVRLNVSAGGSTVSTLLVFGKVVVVVWFGECGAVF